MSKLTLEDLRKLRDVRSKEIHQRDTGAKDVQIVVGMGTCGIAAGAKDTLNALVDAVAAQKLGHVLVRQTGCMGLCHSEPTVEVAVPGMPKVVYGKVKAEQAATIIEQHVLGKRLVDSHILDRPAIDLLR